MKTFPNRPLTGNNLRHSLGKLGYALLMAEKEQNAVGLDGLNVTQRVANSGYQARGAIENVGNARPGTPDRDIVRAWMAGIWKGNILFPYAVETGVGAAQSRSGIWYFCQIFTFPEPGPSRVVVALSNQLPVKVTFQIGGETKSLKSGEFIWVVKQVFTTKLSAVGTLPLVVTWPAHVVNGKSVKGTLTTTVRSGIHGFVVQPNGDYALTTSTLL